MAAQKFSGGNQQRIVIAKWLATDPKILIVDEPTNGIDVGAKDEIHKLLRELAGKGDVYKRQEQPCGRSAGKFQWIREKSRISAKNRKLPARQTSSLKTGI